MTHQNHHVRNSNLKKLIHFTFFQTSTFLQTSSWIRRFFQLKIPSIHRKIFEHMNESMEWILHSVFRTTLFLPQKDEYRLSSTWETHRIINSICWNVSFYLFSLSFDCHFLYHGFNKRQTIHQIHFNVCSQLLRHQTKLIFLLHKIIDDFESTNWKTTNWKCWNHFEREKSPRIEGIMQQIDAFFFSYFQRWFHVTKGKRFICI